jgi:putative MATE family efflux protein
MAHCSHRVILWWWKVTNEKTLTDSTSLLKGFYRALVLIAVPIIMQNLMQTFINMLDTIMVGRLGAVEIAAVGLGNQVFFMLNMVLFGISSGGSIFVAQFWGKKDIDGIQHTLGMTLSASVVVSLIFMTGALVMPATIIGWYTNDPAVIAIGAKYLRIAGLSYPLMAISFAYQLAFRSTEHVYLPMAATAVSLVMNFFFNWLFIFGVSLSFGQFTFAVPAYGVAGAAAATVIARGGELLVTLIYPYTHHFEAAGNVKVMLAFSREFAARLLKVTFPVIINESLWGFGITMQNSIFAHAGTDAIAAFNITNTINQLTWVFFIGMGNGAAIIIGKRIGAGEENAARAYANRFSWFMPLMGVVFGSLLFPLSLTLKFIFNVEPHIIGIAQSMMYVLMCFYPLHAFNMLLIVGICRSGGDTIFAAFNDNGWMWAVAIPLGAIAAFVWHQSPWVIYICLESEQLFKTLTGIIRVRSGKWLHNVTV